MFQVTIVLNRMWSQQICFLKCFKSPCSKNSNIQISSYSLNSFCNYLGLKRNYMTWRNRKKFHALGGYHLFTFLYERSIQFRNLYIWYCIRVPIFHHNMRPGLRTVSLDLVVFLFDDVLAGGCSDYKENGLWFLQILNLLA